MSLRESLLSGSLDGNLSGRSFESSFSGLRVQYGLEQNRLVLVELFKLILVARVRYFLCVGGRVNKIRLEARVVLKRGQQKKRS